MIPRKILWTKQPPENTKINYGHPLAKGLTFCVMGANEFDTATGDFNTTLQNSVPETGQHGKSRNVGSTIDDGITFPHNQRHNSTEKTVIVFCQSVSAGEGSFQVFIGKQASQATRTIFFGRNSSDAATFGFRNTVSGNSLDQGSTVFADSTVPVCYGVTFNQPNVKYYINGLLKETNSLDTIPDTTFTGKIAVGRADGETGISGADIIVYLALLYNRDLSEAEMLSLYKNPWQLFQPRTAYIPLPEIAAAGGASLAAGSLTTMGVGI